MLDLTKPVQTRGGDEAEIAWTDGGGDFPVMGRYRKNHPGKVWVTAQWTMMGKYYAGGPSFLDLVNVPAKIRVHRWINVSRLSDGELTTTTCDNREMADELSSIQLRDNRIACYELDIEIEEGHGL